MALVVDFPWRWPCVCVLQWSCCMVLKINVSSFRSVGANQTFVETWFLDLLC